MNIEIGDVFGKWVVISEPFKKNGKYYVTCKCSCSKGTIRDVQKSYLLSGRSTSCGCSNNYKINDDMIGSIFGKLIVLERVDSDDNNTSWLCKCECGNTTIVKGFKLRNGHTKSCGHCDHSGEVINGVELVEKLHGAWYKCRCPYCGNYFEQLYSKLSSGHVRSCGCKANNYIDMVGKVFGRWKVIAPTEDKRFWLCECLCENHTRRVVNGESLRIGTSTSCGCRFNNFSGSIGENEVKDFIKSIISDEPKKVKILNGKEIDLYYEKYNIGIEYNGSVYHASINGLYDNKPKYYHRDKFLLAKEKGIHLISIFDVDWESNQEKIKNYLEDIFVKSNVLYARKCSIVTIDKWRANSFCDNYHLQGGSRLSTIHLGLFYNDELMSVMTFGRQRRHKNSDTDFELIRYCVRSKCIIVGGANKLLRYFEINYSPSTLISYSNNDYFIGNIYEKLGFTCSGQTSVSYYWLYKDSELKREQCQVKKLAKKYPDIYSEAIDNKVFNKEDYIMSKLGARKVYRCGNTKWVKFYN